MVEESVDVEQARILLLAIGAPTDGLESAVAFDDLLQRVEASPRIVVHDWRGELAEGLETVASVIGHDGYELEYELGEEVSRAVVSYRGKTANVKYVPADDDFNYVLAAIERLIDGGVKFRSTIVGLESDTYELIGLPAKEWDVLDDAIPSLVRRVFPGSRPSSAEKSGPETTKKPGFLRRLLGG